MSLPLPVPVPVAAVSSVWDAAAHAAALAGRVPLCRVLARLLPLPLHCLLGLRRRLSAAAPADGQIAARGRSPAAAALGAEPPGDPRMKVLITIVIEFVISLTAVTPRLP